ncbi:hypothetical protein CQ018_16410 [Arthrobacter sp. MYb227]|uniref:fluoride efflux transporter FluC n=1 Tax=Arthrobacter sp. MYb227 TaxID=1848601 RepID=UPI000CFC72A1|nr:CrcB family protein [Arthrobacter sp. MYb227]PQZ88576.1 hypothetical protein CQ018_16410 [Arthrobacter sp. MYb227]
MSFLSLTALVVLALAGAAGAMLRYLIDVSFTAAQVRQAPRRKHYFPWGIFSANTLACFLMAGILGVAAHTGVQLQLDRLLNAQGAGDPLSFSVSLVLLALSIGFCGSLSTMSTLMVSVLALSRSGARTMALAYLGVSLAAGLAAGSLGYYIPTLF